MPKETINQNNLLFYQCVSLEGVQDILVGCLKRYDEDHNISWLEMAKDCHLTIVSMSQELMQGYYNGHYRPRDDIEK